MFIVCGVLYAVDSVTDRNTKIRLALDLYRNQLLDDVNLSFTNPFKRTTTVGYNHRSKVLWTENTIFISKMKKFNIFCYFIRRNCIRGIKEINSHIQHDIMKLVITFRPAKRLMI